MIDGHPADLTRRNLPWLAGPGEHQGIVVSSRVRLARNLDGWRFAARLDQREQQDLVNLLVDRITHLPGWEGAWRWYLLQLPEVERLALLERRLVSRQLMESKRPTAVLVNGAETTSLMINEEDHLRLQCIRNGLDIAGCLAQAQELDIRLESTCRWAVHEDYGYLTSCPTNAGTGLRAGVMLHLPGLVLSKQIPKTLRALTKLDMTARGIYGEGSEARGHLFQVSNQRTLGMDEDEICGALDDVVRDIIQWEQLARQALVRDELALEDRIHRSLAILGSARRLSSTEFMELWSLVRLGLATGIILNPDWATLDEAFRCCQTAHLRLGGMDAEEPAARDRLRADRLRTLLRRES